MSSEVVVHLGISPSFSKFVPSTDDPLRPAVLGPSPASQHHTLEYSSIIKINCCPFLNSDYKSVQITPFQWVSRPRSCLYYPITPVECTLILKCDDTHHNTAVGESPHPPKRLSPNKQNKNVCRTWRLHSIDDDIPWTPSI